MAETKSRSLFFLFSLSFGILVTGVSGSDKCYDNRRVTDSTVASCCKVKYDSDGSGFSVSRFPCKNGCCGKEENQYCCSDPSETQSLIIGLSVFGVLLFIGLVIFLVFIFRKACRGFKEYSSHKKLIKEVYKARTLDELFVPSQPLVSAPGTVVHPVTNVSGSSYARDGEAYVVPDFNQPQVDPRPNVRQNDQEDFNEENWDTWDGFPTADVGASASGGNETAGRGRDNPYYEQYDNYSQPPPAYDELTK